MASTTRIRSLGPTTTRVFNPVTRLVAGNIRAAQERFVPLGPPTR
jgi:hypothetical protein